jgi:hypothetical protein
MALTDTACKNAKCPRDKARVPLTDSGGLYLEVVPTGGKLWRWKFRYAGKEKRLALGSYPAVSLANARRARDDARDQLKTGLDPVAAKKLVKVAQEAARANNFEAVARAWFDHWKDNKSGRRAEYVLRRLEADVVPSIGPRPFRGIASTILHELEYRHDIIELQLAHQERDQVSAAYNFATYLPQRRKMMQDWADHLEQLRIGAKIILLKAA